jgi:hypothetical protein
MKNKSFLEKYGNKKYPMVFKSITEKQLDIMKIQLEIIGELRNKSKRFK